MVDKLKAILAKIHESDREVVLFAMLKIDDITDRWSIIFSEPGLDDNERRKEEFVYLANLLISNLDEKEIETIARVSVRPLSDHLVESLLKYKTGYKFDESTPVNGNTVHEGYVLESTNAAAPDASS